MQMASGVKEKLVAIVQEIKGVDAANAVKQFSHFVADRFATDVFE